MPALSALVRYVPSATTARQLRELSVALEATASLEPLSAA